MIMAGSAAAQSGSRTAIVYGARVAGDTTWQFGSLSTISSISAPVAIEVATFLYRSQGVGVSTAVFKTYIDTIASNSVSIVEDVTNSLPASGVDGRTGFFNFGPQSQIAFRNRNASIPGSGFRISSSADMADMGAPGGINVHQRPPLDTSGTVNPDFVQDDGILTYRFNVIVSPVTFPGAQAIHVYTPSNRFSGFSVYNSLTSAATTDLKAQVQIDAIDLNVAWVPSAGSLPVLAFSGLVSVRRRRR